MNLIIDIGNTRIKRAHFEGRTLLNKAAFNNTSELIDDLKHHRYENMLVSTVGDDASDIIRAVKSSGVQIRLSTALSLPIKVDYDTPNTLGVDRIAAACGAFDLFPGENCLVIDAGTCINYEFISSDGVYHGGAISPGVKMRFAAMHQYTAKLPLAEPVKNPPLTGKSTLTCLQSGVMNGIIEEINGIITRYESQHTRLKPLLCGGDAGLFENTLKPSIFVAPDLVLIGLNRILLHHAKT